MSFHRLCDHLRHSGLRKGDEHHHIIDFTTMHHINLRFTYLLTYLPLLH